MRHTILSKVRAVSDDCGATRDYTHRLSAVSRKIALLYFMQMCFINAIAHYLC